MTSTQGNCQVIPSDLNNKPKGYRGCHRCYLCSQYPELAGPTLLAIDLDGPGFNWCFCGSCVKKMYHTMFPDQVDK